MNASNQEQKKRLCCRILQHGIILPMLLCCNRCHAHNCTGVDVALLGVLLSGKLERAGMHALGASTACWLKSSGQLHTAAMGDAH